MWEVMTPCVIMHSMIVKDKRDDSISTKGFNFKVKTLCLSMGRPRLHILPNFIQKCVIGQLTLNFKIIWLSTYGLTLATIRCIFFFFRCIFDNLNLVVNYEIFCRKTSDLFIYNQGSTTNTINNKNYIQIRRPPTNDYKH